MMIEYVNDIFEETKKGIREILQSDMLKNIAKYIYKDHEFKLEHSDIQEMLPNIQAINLGVLDEVVVKDKDGNEITLTADEYIQRNYVGLKNKAKEEVDLTFLNGILDGIQTFAEFVDFGSLEMAKAKYLPEPEEEPEEIVEEEVVEEEQEEE